MSSQPDVVTGHWWRRNVQSKLPILGSKFPRLTKWLSLIVGAAGCATGASAMTLSVYQMALREKIQQSEEESNMMAQFCNIGALLAFPAGMLYETLGSQVPSVIGGLLATSMYTLMALGTSWWRVFFAQNMWLVHIIWFFIGFSSIFFYMGSMMPNVHNFSIKHRGKVIGSLDAILSMGPTLFSVIYNTKFTDGFTKEGEEGMQNLSGFFQFLAFVSATVAILLFFFTGRLKEHIVEHDADDESERELIVNSRALEDWEEMPPNDYSEIPFKEESVPTIFKSFTFYLFVLQFLLASSVQTTFQVNISTYLESFNLTEYNMLFTTLNTALQSVSKFSIGLISDFIAERDLAPRSVGFLLPYILQTAILFVSIFYGDRFIILLLTCIFVGVAYGAAWTQSPTLMSELYGSQFLASNWGWTLLFSGLAGFPYSVSFSWIYEQKMHTSKENCYGLECFTWSFAILAVSSAGALLMAVGLVQNMYRNASDRRKLRAQALQNPLRDDESHDIA